MSRIPVAVTSHRKVPEYRQLAAFASWAIGSGALSWRHHGIGVLQAYLVESAPPFTEHRLHIWHPSLAVPGMELSGAMHDHRFDLLSTVLCGEMFHDELHLFADDAGEWVTYRVVNARRAFGQIEAPTPEPGRYTVRSNRHVFGPGDSYFFPEGAFHRSSVSGLTVTVVSKLNQRDRQARILSKGDREVQHAFLATSPREGVDELAARIPRDFSPILTDAAQALSEVAGGAS